MQSGHGRSTSVLNQFIGYEESLKFLTGDNLSTAEFSKYLTNFQAKTRYLLPFY
jgi:dTDP-glucose pyrophosphorylase